MEVKCIIICLELYKSSRSRSSTIHVSKRTHQWSWVRQVILINIVNIKHHLSIMLIVTVAIVGIVIVHVILDIIICLVLMLLSIIMLQKGKIKIINPDVYLFYHFTLFFLSLSQYHILKVKLFLSLHKSSENRGSECFLVLFFLVRIASIKLRSH